MRAREWISCELDGELSQFERAFLHAHTRRCAACAALRVDFAGLADALRGAPLVALERHVSLPPRRMLVRRRLVSSAAAAAAFAAAALIAVGTGIEPSAPRDDRAVGAAYPAVNVNDDRLLRTLQRRSWRVNPGGLTIARRLHLERL